MKKLSIAAFCLSSLISTNAQDSLQVKKDEITSGLKYAFTGDWSYQLLDSSMILKWDTMFLLPTSLLRVNILSGDKNDPPAATTYFYKFSDADTVIKTILSKNIIEGLKDSSDFDFTFPLINMNHRYLAISFNCSEENLNVFQEKLKEGLGLDKAEVKLSDIREDARPSPLPPLLHLNLKEVK